MFKKIIIFFFVFISLAGCVDESSSSTYSYQPNISTVTPINYITITKSNFGQYFSGSVPTPDDSGCTYSGCKLPATYSFTFTKKSNFKIDTSIYLTFSGTASLILFPPNQPQSNGTGSVSGSMTMSGNANSFAGKFTISCASAGCGSVNVRISTPRWEISSISGRIYF